MCNFWSLTIYDYGIWLRPSRSGEMSNCNHTPFPLCEGGVWHETTLHLAGWGLETRLYRITGNFGGGFNLAIWRLKSLSPNLNSPIFNCLAACDVRVCVPHDYTCTCMQCRRERKRAMALYRFFQRKERPVVPTLSMCGASSLSMKELERANDYVSCVFCPGDGESGKLTP